MFSSAGNSARPPSRARFQRAFTLVEILVILTVASVLATAGYVAVQNAREASDRGKLENDVAAVNRAVQVYLAEGGDLSQAATPAAVVEKLKTRVATNLAASHPGLRGSMADSRLGVVEQTDAEAATPQARARWNSATRRFEIFTDGPRGVKYFVLDDTLAGSTAVENRTASLPLASTEKWVWDYTDFEPGPPAGAAPPATSPLDPPSFTPAGGPQALASFDIGVAINNPNSANVSRVLYSVSGGPWSAYGGQTITVKPDESVRAYAASTVPETHHDSTLAAVSYDVIPVQPQLLVTPPAAELSYEEAGGTMVGQTAQTPPPAVVTLVNTNDIPPDYLNSDGFRVFWTTDNTPPLGSGTAQGGGNFSGAFPPAGIDVSLGQWGSQTNLVIRAAARSVNSRYFVDSGEATATIGIKKTALPPPVFDSPSGNYSGGFYMGIRLDPTAAYPQGARIFYRTDGTDPGNQDGEPAPGAREYTVTVPLFTLQSPTANVITRAYAPQALKAWFSPSDPVSATYVMSGGQPLGAALVGDATVNGRYVGSLILSTAKNMNFNSGAIIAQGNLYVPGTPDINTNNGGVIQGREFLPDGTEVVPPSNTNKIIDLDGNPQPSNYTIRLNSGSTIEGKVYRRITPLTMPTVPLPPSPNNNNTLTVSSPQATPVNPSQWANVNLNNGAGEVTLLPGNYGSLNAGSNTKFVVGTAGATTPSVYNFQSLNLNSLSQLKVVGPVIINIRQNININSQVVLGNPDHPEWLQLNIYSGSFNINSDSAAYANLVAPNSSVNLSGTFRGGVVADTLSITGNGVAITLAPPGT